MVARLARRAHRGRQPVAGGWLFATVRGELWHAPDFLGPLRAVGTTPDLVPTPVRPVQGRAFLLDVHGDVWTTDGRSARTRMPGLSAGGTLLLCFATAELGAAIPDGGALVATADGGRTWAPVDLGGQTAVDLMVEDGSIHIETTQTSLLLGADASVRERYRRIPQPSLDRVTRQRLVNDASPRFPGATREPTRGADRTARFARGVLECRTEGTPTPLAPPRAGFDRIATGDVEAELRIRARREGGASIEIAWRGTDAQGPWRARYAGPFPRGEPGRLRRGSAPSQGGPRTSAARLPRDGRPQ